MPTTIARSYPRSVPVQAASVFPWTGEHEAQQRAALERQRSFGVQPGDLWQLGEHRLYCGDCSLHTSIDVLMRGEMADLLITDPPYGVQYESRRTTIRPILNDDLGGAGLRDLVGSALRVAPLRDGAAFYIWSTAGSAEMVFRNALLDSGLWHKQTIVWVKHHFVLSRQDYHWKHEVLLYGWKPGAGHYFIADRTQHTVWEAPKPTKNKLHPTMKPVALILRAVLNSSKLGEVVFDGFGGSGSTLIACEHAGRRCRIIELEPQYAAAILARWEVVTGRRATLLNRSQGY